MSKVYIDRDMLLNKIGTVPLWTGYREDSYTFEMHLALVAIEKGLKKLISELPAEDVEPVRHGEWIKTYKVKPKKIKRRYTPILR